MENLHCSLLSRIPTDLERSPIMDFPLGESKFGSYWVRMLRGPWGGGAGVIGEEDENRVLVDSCALTTEVGRPVMIRNLGPILYSSFFQKVFWKEGLKKKGKQSDTRTEFFLRRKVEPQTRQVTQEGCGPIKIGLTGFVTRNWSRQ